MPRFTGKVALLTGSSTGIGRATAVMFAKEGAKVTITGRKVDQLEETKKEIIAAGAKAGDVLIVVGDINQQEIRQKLVDETVKTFGKLDILINNAGASISAPDGTTGFNSSLDVLKDNLNINVFSVLEITKLARPHLKASKGDIVNISSVAGQPFANSFAPYYGMAKAALDQLTRAEAADFIQDGIRVNSVSPGIVRTSFLSNTGMGDQTAGKVYDLFEKNAFALPRQDVGKPDEIANVIAFLADRNTSGYIIGQTIIADGGSTLLLGIHTVDITQAFQ